MSTPFCKLYSLLVTLHIFSGVVNQTPPDTVLSINGTDVEVCSLTHLCQPDRCGRIPATADECGCDSACEYFGDCCYDYWSACTFNSPKYNTISKQLECMSDDDSEYYVIALCSEDSTVDTETIEKCENPGSGDVLLEIIVSDKEDKIYKNVYCALCNDIPITEVTAWEVTFSCVDDDIRTEFGLGPQFGPAPGPAPAPPPPPFPVTTEEPPPTTEPPPPNIHEQLGDSALCPFVSFDPPQGKQDTRRPCLTTVRSECDEIYTNTTVIDACKTNYKAIVYDDIPYKNPHCAICNFAQYYLCERIDIQAGRFGFTPLTVVVDFSAKSSISVSSDYGSYENEGVTCPTGEVFDPFSNQCLKLTCKDGFILEGSRCVAPLATPTCDDSALHVTNEIFCECKLQRQSLQIDFDYLDYDLDVFTFVDAFRENLNSKGIQYIEESMNSANMTVKSILIEAISCQIVYDISELLTMQINNKTDSQLNVVTLWQNCSTEEIPSELHCDYDSLLLTAGEELYYDNDTRTIRAGNSSTQIPDNEYVLELVHTLGNESSVCSSVSMLTCEVCAHVQLASTAFQDEGNGTLIYRTTGDVFQQRQYLFSDASNSSVLVCSFLNQTGTTDVDTQFFHYSGSLLIVSVVCTIASLICLLFTILLRAFLAELRTLSGKIILNVSVALFFALLLTLIQGNFTEWLIPCKIVAGVLHYLWLVCFFWMNAMAIELFQTFRLNKGSSRSSRSKTAQQKSFKSYFIYSWFTPAIYVGVIIAVSELTSLDVMYGDDSVCWIRDELASFYVFGIPLALILIPNFILFVATIRGIHKSMKSAAVVRSGKSDQGQQAGEMIIYIRISTVMGLSWIFGFLASFIDDIVLWYLFTILNSLQGVFIFIAFNINHSMKNILMKRKEAQQTSTQPKTGETLLPANGKDNNSENISEHLVIESRNL